MKIRNIVLIGYGKVSQHLYRLLTAKDYNILQIYNRNLAKIDVDCHKIDDLNHLNKSADLYIIAVKDSVISKLSTQINVNDKLICHTAGAARYDILRECSTNIGVIYPLQSFSHKIPLSHSSIPLIYNANNTHSIELLKKLANSISDININLDYDKRLFLNLSGVFVNNFTNYIYTVVYDMLKNEGIEFRVLLPLIENTVYKLGISPPILNQTGPAVRNDKGTIDMHLELLKNNDMKEIYSLFTSLIQKYGYDK